MNRVRVKVLSGPWPKVLEVEINDFLEQMEGDGCKLMSIQYQHCEGEEFATYSALIQYKLLWE